MSTSDFFEIYDVPGDGDCLFSSIADQIMQETGEQYNLSEAADILRNQVVSNVRIMDNPEEIYILSIAVDRELSEYIEEMSRKYTYGDYVCIAVLSKVLNRNILVWNENGEIIHSEIIDGNDMIYNILYIAEGLHYKSMRKFFY